MSCVNFSHKVSGLSESGTKPSIASSESNCVGDSSWIGSGLERIGSTGTGEEVTCLVGDVRFILNGL